MSEWMRAAGEWLAAPGQWTNADDIMWGLLLLRIILFGFDPLPWQRRR